VIGYIYLSIYVVSQKKKNLSIYIIYYKKTKELKNIAHHKTLLYLYPSNIYYI